MNKILSKWASVQTLVRTLADNAKLRVEYEDSNSSVGPRTDGKTIYIPKPDYNCTEEEFTLWLSSIYHEIGHNVPEMRDCFAIPKKYKVDMQSFTGVCLNVLEDYRQEQYKIDDYLGKKRVLGEGRWIATKKFHGILPSEDKKRDALLSLMAWETACREGWMPELIGASDLFTKNFSKEQREYISKLSAGNYQEELDNITTAEDTYALTKRILTEVFNFDPDKEKGDGAGNGQGQGQGEDTEGKNGSSEDSGDGEIEKQNKASTVKYDDLLMHKHGNKSASYTPLTIDYTGSKKQNDTYIPYMQHEFTIDNCKKLSKNYRYDSRIPTNATGFSNKVKRLLMVLSKDKNDYGKKYGRLHSKNLYRVTIPQSGEFGKKVFKQKKVSDVLDTAVFILIDMSGSMGGDKVVHACHSGILLNEAITKLQVPTEIVGFTDGCYGPTHTVMKSFTSNLTAEKLRDRMVHATNNMDSNADGDSLLWSYNRLKKRKEKKKVLIVLSDGQPASQRGWGGVQFLKEVTSMIQKEGIVNLYGIGIQSTAVQSYYKECCVINNSSELEEKLLEVVKTKMLN